jgi:hypothetical protein
LRGKDRTWRFLLTGSFINTKDLETFLLPTCSFFTKGSAFQEPETDDLEFTTFEPRVSYGLNNPLSFFLTLQLRRNHDNGSSPSIHCSRSHSPTSYILLFLPRTLHRRLLRPRPNNNPTHQRLQTLQIQHRPRDRDRDF